MKKADNFDAGKWLVENKVTTQSRLNEALAGHMGAVSSATKNAKSPSGDSTSDKPDEFSLSILVNPMYKRYANYNYKLKDVEFEKPKTQEGFLSNLFSSSPTIKFIFDKVSDGKKATIQIKLKNDEFVLNNSSTSDEEVGTIPDSGEATKFINYLLGQSQWKDDLSKSFENIKDKLKPSSFK
jgi:hypothetical protein